MDELEPSSVDLPSLAWLAGSAANERVLAELHAAGHRGLRISHGFVFQHLVDREPTVGELAEALEVSQQAASKAVGELEALGFVERAPDRADSRVRRVVLTRSGRRAVADARAARRALQARCAARTSTADVESARAVLVALLEASGGMPAVRGRRVRPS